LAYKATLFPAAIRMYSLNATMYHRANSSTIQTTH